MLLISILVLPQLVYAAGTSNNPTGADDYYNVIINTDITLIQSDFFTPIKKIERNTPVHLTGKVKKVEGETGVDDNGDPTYGTITYVEVELQDGTIGWTSDEFITEKQAELSMFVKKDVYLLSKPDNSTKTTKVAYEGEKVVVKEKSGKYAKIVQGKTEGWILTSNLVQLEPKYLYSTKKCSYYYNEWLNKKERSGTANLGERGILAKGTKVEYIHTMSRDKLKDKVYLVLTPTKEWAYVDARHFTFAVPKTLYTDSDTTLYSSASSKSKEVAKVKMGTKLTRLFTEGSYYKVKLPNKKTGWIGKNKCSTQKIVPVKKNYGTYYLTKNLWEKDTTYPIGTKIIQVDPLFYEYSDKKSKAKKHKYPYDLVFAQLPDGRIDGFYITKNSGEATALPNKKEAMAMERKMNTHAKKAEKKIFQQLNSYRKKKGVKPLIWNDINYKYADSYFDFCVMVGSTSFPHAPNAHGWLGAFHDIIFSGVASNTEDAGNVAIKYAMDSWKESPGHNDMLLNKDYKYAAVCVMYSDTNSRMEAVIMCSKTKPPFKFTKEEDHYMAKTWYPFVYKDPKFTNKRGDAYTGNMS